MANLYQWLKGGLTDVFSNVTLTSSNSSIVADSSRYGSHNAFEIGATTNAGATLYTGYNASGPDALPNLGTGDATVTFWWQPNNSSYGGGGQRHLFQYLPGAAMEVYHNADLSTDSQDDYNIYARFRYGNGSPAKSKFFDIDLTNNPWIKVYASRIGGAFYYTLYNADGSVLTDKDGDAATWTDATQTGNIYNASGSSPHIRVGGDFAAGQSGGGIYDDIFLTLDYGIGTGSLQLDSDGYAKQNPIINSFNASATSVSSGDTVNLSWDVTFGTTLQLLKYIGGILSSTETVTDTSSKSVTITQAVSYRLRGTNYYGSSDSSTIDISLGGNDMAIVYALSGSEPAQSIQVNANLLGGVQLDNATGRIQSLAVGSFADGRNTINTLSSSFGSDHRSIIQALNHLKAQSEGKSSSGPTGSVQLSDGSGGFTAIGALRVNSNGDMHVPAKLDVTGAADLASSLTVDGASILGATTGVQVSAAGLLTVNNATDASSKTAGAAIIDGGLAVALKAHVGTGLTVDAGGVTVTAGTSAVQALTATTISGSSNLKIGGTSELGSLTSVAISNAGVVDIENATASTSKTTGALKVAGGISSQLKIHAGTGLTVDEGGATITAGGVTVTNGGIEVDGGAVNIDDTTASTSKTTGALKVAGGLSAQLKGHFGTGLTVDAGGITVTAGASEFGAGATFAGGVTASKDLSVGESLLVSQGATITTTLGVGGVATFAAGAGFAGAVTASTDLTVGQNLVVTKTSQLRSNVAVSTPGAANFSELPIFSIQGTTLAGAIDDFRLVVSGGILRAIAI